MGEIKSTLDLVMERTRNLTLSMKEKEGQQNADLKKRLTGLAQKYEDQIIKLTEFIDMLNELKKTFGPKVENRMVDEILDRIRVETDNDRYMELLTNHFGVEIPALKAIQSEFSQALQKKKVNHIDKMKTRLSDQHGISGTAVIPNIENDPAWQKKHRTLIDQFQSRLDTEKKEAVHSLNP